MKQRFINFMRSRYGLDQLSRFLAWGSIILMLFGCLVNLTPIYCLGFLILIYSYYRIFSKNYNARYRENQWYLEHTAPIRDYFRTSSRHMHIRKTHHIYTCKSCHQKIRIPKGKGKIQITCPNCGNSFIKRS